MCPELDDGSQGETVEDSLRNIKEALELYMEDEEVEKLSVTEASIATVVRVNVCVSTRILSGKKFCTTLKLEASLITY